MSVLERELLHVELGCGERFMGGTVRGAKAIGVDFDIAVLDAARRSDPRRILVCADARRLPFQTGSVDDFSLRAVLHHLVPVEPVLEELARTLRPGGTVVVIDGVALDCDEAACLDAELASAGLDAEPIYGFNLDELPELFEAAGLHVDDLRLEGTATFATPPHVSRPFTSDRFQLSARRL